MSISANHLDKALLKAQQAIKSIAKDSYNDFAKFHYVGSEQMVQEARQVLHDNGLVLVRDSWELIYGGPIPAVRSVFRLMHADTGTFKTFNADYLVLEAKGKPLDKALNGALTTSLSYFLRDLLLIPRLDESEVDNPKNDRKAIKEERDGDLLFEDTPAQNATVMGWLKSNGYGEKRIADAWGYFLGKSMSEIKAMIEKGAKKEK